jgi:hypothetical protein
MDSISQDTIQRYKQCAGRGCSEQGIHYLKIRYIHKHGWFCDSCKNAIIGDKLADEVIDGAD